MASPEQVIQIVTVLDAMYPKDVAFLTQQQIAARAATYARLLADIDAAMLSLAVDQYIAAGGKDYPSVKALRDMALGMALSADDAPDAAMAWRQACDAVKPDYSVGGDCYGVSADARRKLHPRVVKAIEYFGVSRIGVRLDKDAGTDFAQWRGLYESLAHRADEQARWLPQVRERIALMRAEMDAAKLARIEAPAEAVPVSAARPANGRAPVRIAELLNADAPQMTKDQLDRRAHAARLIARRDVLRDQLRIETDETKRRAIEMQIDGITRTVAQYETQCDALREGVPARREMVHA